MNRLGHFILAVILAAALPLTARAAGPEVAGKSAVLMELSTGQILYEKNAEASLAPASVTKVMTMLLIMEAIDGGRISWTDTVTASETAAAKGGSQVYLKAGESMTVSDMVKAIAVSSANDCACAMAEHLAGSESAFVDQMNAKAAQLGMANTHFVNCTGLDDSPDAEAHRTSARDIAIMSRELLTKHPAIREYTTIWMDTLRDGSFGLSNTNKLVRFYPGCTGLKTGFTASAGYCLSASASRDGMELVAVVMGAESSQARFAACKTLLDTGFAEYGLYTPQGEDLAVPVRLGASDTVAAVAGEQAPLLVKKAALSAISREITLTESVTAPVEAGTALGELTVFSGAEVLARIPLVAAEPVAKLTWPEMALRLLGRTAMASPEAL